MTQQRYLKKLTNNTVWPWSEQGAKKPDMIEISEEEKNFLLCQDRSKCEGCESAPRCTQGKTEVPTYMVPTEIMNILSKLSTEQIEDLVKAGQMMLNPNAQVEEAAAESKGTMAPEEMLKNDPEMKVDSFDINKPLIRMNKGELDMYAQIKHQKFFDVDKTTRNDMLEEIKKLDAGKAEQGEFDNI